MVLLDRKCVVGIFSRESEDSYTWLTQRLLKFVRDVRPVYISNNVTEIRNHTEKCGFAIIYHSKNRGRVNVTDVTDSLYDKELEYLSGMLGSKNVLVVIDDLDDGSDAAKDQILANQPSIKRWAKDLILFTREEKSSPDNESVRRKLDKMKKIIPGGFTGYGSQSSDTRDSDIGSRRSQRECCNTRLLVILLIILVVVTLVAFIVFVILITINYKNHSETPASNLTNSSHTHP